MERCLRIVSHRHRAARNSLASIRLETTSRKTQLHVAQSHWIGSETAEHWSFLCVEESSPSRTPAFDCGHGYAQEEYAMKTKKEMITIGQCYLLYQTSRTLVFSCGHCYAQEEYAMKRREMHFRNTFYISCQILWRLGKLLKRYRDVLHFPGKINKFSIRSCLRELKKLMVTE